MSRLLLTMLCIAPVITWAEVQTAEIRVGFAYPLSGPYAVSGERSRIATELAIADLNERGGVLGQRVTLVAVDDACGLQRAIDAAHELVEAGVSLVIGHMCSHSSLLAAGVYETADVLMITHASTHLRLTEEGRENVFRLIGRDDRQGRLAGNFLADRWAGRRIAILHDGTVYGEGLTLQARRQLHERGETEVLYDRYAPGSDDYGPLVAHLQKARVDVLYVGGYGPDAGRIVRTAREAGDDLQLVGGDALGMAEFWNVAGGSGKGTIYSGRAEHGDAAVTAALGARFRQEGLGTRGGDLGAYAAIQVWGESVARAGSLELRAVAKALRRGRFTTVLGPVAFDDKGDLRGVAWRWKVWTRGDTVPMAEVAVTQ